MPGAMVEVVGAARARHDLALIEERLGSTGVVLEAEMKLLEIAEGMVFGGLGGQFVQTGATMASLTQSSANGAIRRIHGTEIEFGTSIWYAHFLRDIGGPSGKPRGRKRVGPSKVLKLTPTETRAAAQLVLDRIVGRV